MRVNIVMVMQTTLMDLLHVLLDPSTGLGQIGAPPPPPLSQRTFKFNFLFFSLL